MFQSTGPARFRACWRRAKRRCSAARPCTYRQATQTTYSLVWMASRKVCWARPGTRRRPTLSPEPSGAASGFRYQEVDCRWQDAHFQRGEPGKVAVELDRSRGLRLDRHRPDSNLTHMPRPLYSPKHEPANDRPGLQQPIRRENANIKVSIVRGDIVAGWKARAQDETSI